MTISAALVSIGGSRWQKAGKDRVYFNGLCALYGLELEHYRSGNISAAWVDGEPISNSHAFDLQLTLSAAKLWFDCSDGKFHAQGLTQAQHDHLVARIKAKLNTVVTETPKTAESLPEGYVKADCGHVIQRIHLMNASVGQTCPDCYDRYAG